MDAQVEVRRADEPKLVIASLERVYSWLVPLHWPIIRLGAGLIMLVHGIGHLPPAFAAWSPEFVKKGFFPSTEWAYSILFLETVGAACVGLGLFTRFFAAALAIECGVIFLQFLPNGFSWSQKGYEYLLLWSLVFFAIAIRGGGPYSLDRKIGYEL